MNIVHNSVVCRCYAVEIIDVSRIVTSRLQTFFMIIGLSWYESVSTTTTTSTLIHKVDFEFSSFANLTIHINLLLVVSYPLLITVIDKVKCIIISIIKQNKHKNNKCEDKIPTYHVAVNYEYTNYKLYVA